MRKQTGDMTLTKDNFFKKNPVNGKISKNSFDEAKLVIDPKETPELAKAAEYVNNLHDQKTINVDDIGKKDLNQKLTIDFMNEGSMLDYTASKSKDSTGSDTFKSQFDNKSIDDVRKDIKDAELHAANTYTPKDYEEMAGFVIDVIDTGLSQLCKWWSKEPSDAEFSLGKEKRNRLVRQLTLILCKYQSKFSLEFMFILTLVFLYGPALLAANKKRKEKAEVEAQTNLKIVHHNPNVQQPMQQHAVNQEHFNQHSNGNIYKEPSLNDLNPPGKRGPKRKTKPNKL